MSYPFFNTNQSGLNINANNISLIGTTGAGIIHNDSTGKLFSTLIQGSDIGYQTITSDKLSPDIIFVGTTGAQGPQGIQGPQGSLGKGFKVFMSGLTIDNSVTSAFYDSGSGTHVGEFFLMTGGNMFCYIPGTLANVGTGDYVDFKFSGDVTNESVLRGEQGSTGSQGTNGIQGSAGVAGTNGIQGSTGAAGAAGTNGIQGSTGAAGAQGLQGIGSTGSIITDNNTTTTSYLVLTNATDPTNYQSLSADTTTGPLSYVPSTGVLTVGALNVGNGFTNTNNFYNPINFAGQTASSRQITDVSKIILSDINNVASNKSTIWQQNNTLYLSPNAGGTGNQDVIVYAANNVGTLVEGLRVSTDGSTTSSAIIQNKIKIRDPINGGEYYTAVDGSQGYKTNTNALKANSRTQWVETNQAGGSQTTFSSTAEIMNFYVPVTVGANNLKCSYVTAANDDVVNKLYCDNKVAALVASAPATLDTLNELAVALGNDPNYATSTATLIGTKASLTAAQTISGVNTLSNASNVYYGSGANLTGVNAATLTTTTLPYTGTFYFPVTTSATGTSALTPYTQNQISYNPLSNVVTVPHLSTTGTININSWFDSANPSNESLSIKTSNSNRSIKFLPNAGIWGAYGMFNSYGDNIIVATGTLNSESITLSTFSGTSNGVKVSGNAVLLGAGGTSIIPTTNLSINGAANTLSLTTNSIAAISIASTGISTFSAPPQCSVAPTTANMLCNKTYVDAQNSSSTIVIGTAITAAINLSTTTLAGFYTISTTGTGNTSAYNITLPNPANAIGVNVSFRRIVGTKTATFVTVSDTSCFMASSITPGNYTLSKNIIFSLNFTTLLCDGTYWFQSVNC